MILRWPSIRTSAVAAASLTLLAGCAGGSDGQPGAAGSCTAPGVTADTVTVGYLYPDSGPFAEVFIPARGAVDARVAHQNALGGVHGRQIEVEWRDDASDLDQNRLQATDLVEREDVLAILQTTATAAGSADYLDSAGVPTVGIATDLSWAEHRNMFAHAYVYTDGPSVSTFGAYVRQQGGHRAFLVEDFADSTNIGQGMVRSVEAQNIPIVDKASFSAAGESPAVVVQKIRESGADVLLGGLPGPSFAPIVAELHRQQVPMSVILGVSGYDQDLLRQYGAGLANLSVYIPYVAFESQSPALATYRQQLAQYAPQLQTPDREAAIQSYIATDLLIRGLDAAGECPTRASFITNLRAVDSYDGAGLLPAPIDLDEDFGVLASCYFIVRATETGDRFEPQRAAGASDDRWCGTGV